MPNMANITVKNAAGTDVIYNAATPSAGDRSAAVWRQNAASGIVGHRPQFQVIVRANGAGNGRILEAKGTFPIVEDVNGVPTIQARVPFSVSCTLATNVSSTKVLDAYTQFANLAASTLMKSVADETYAPT